MNLIEQLHQGNTRANRDRIAHWIGTDARRFADLMRVYLLGDIREAQLAAGVLFSSFEFHPELLSPWLPKVVRRMDEEGVHPAVRRFGVWALQCIEIPRSLQGRVTDACFRYLSDPTEPIAIRAFAMTVLARIAEAEPELTRELRQTIDSILPYGTAAALRARAGHVLKRLEKLKSTNAQKATKRDPRAKPPY